MCGLQDREGAGEPVAGCEFRGEGYKRGVLVAGSEVRVSGLVNCELRVMSSGVRVDSNLRQIQNG